MTLKLLLIDQDIPFIVTIKQALETSGDFRVSLAANANAAEDLLRDGGYDAVVADFDIPDMDVMEMLWRLRRVAQNIPIIMCPHSNLNYERLHFMDVQGAIAKPYAARDLILYVRDVVKRTKTPPPPPRKPAAADILREFEALEDVQPGTRALSDEKPDQSKTQLLSDEPSEPSGTRILDEEEPAGTRLLDQPDEPSDTTLLPDRPEAAETRQLPTTDNLDKLIESHGWEIRRPAQTKPLPPRGDEPPRKVDDTPAVPDQDLEGMRQFLATDQGAHDPSDFGEVLDAVAQTPPAEYDLSPDNQAFHDLVDSMRPPEQDRVRRSRLEELLASIAADVPDDQPSPTADNTLDYVLDAIRRSASAETPIEASKADLDDTTIGEVMDGLYGPSFEEVLAALAGKEIPGESFEESTYGRPSDAAESLEPSSEDRFTPEEMSADEDRPAWLEAYEAEGIEPSYVPPPRPAIIEPPVSSEDSSHYPATTALTAATSPDKESEFSLNALLAEIENQLPAVPLHRPRLKPLPSWQKKGDLEAPQDVHSLFDHLEGVRSEKPAPGEMAEALADDTAPEMFARPETAPEMDLIWAEPPQVVADTHPALPVQEILESSPEPEFEAAPYEPEFDQVRPLPEDRISPPEPAEASAFSEHDPLPPGLLTINDLYALADPPSAFDVARSEPETSAEEEAGSMPPDEWAADRPTYEDEPHSAENEYENAFEPDVDHLIPVPADTAALLFGGEISVEQAVADETKLAQAAVQLTQYALESSAQATLLSRPGKLLAQAGLLPVVAMERLFYIVDAAWQTGPATSDALIRFITLPDIGEFLLYSTLVDNGLMLSMIFNATTPVRTIRRQARRLSESLELIPEAPAAVAEEPPAAKTLPNRPTDLRPPAGLHEAALAMPTVPESLPARPGSDEPYMAYTCLWLPHDPGQEMLGNFADDLAEWIHEVALNSRWEVHQLDVKPDYIQLSLSIPQKTLPDSAVTLLMRETTQRTTQTYPVLINSSPLWTDGYYIVAPPRELSEREVARFITYQRQAQLG